jgi:hypothetical protein
VVVKREVVVKQEESQEGEQEINQGDEEQNQEEGLGEFKSNEELSSQVRPTRRKSLDLDEKRKS